MGFNSGFKGLRRPEHTTIVSSDLLFSLRSTKLWAVQTDYDEDRCL